MIFGRLQRFEICIAAAVSFIAVVPSLLIKTKNLIKDEQEKQRRAETVCGTDPVFGGFVHRSFYNTWSVSPAFLSATKVRIRGEGSKPNEKQRILWREMDSDFIKLIEIANQALHNDPQKPLGCELETLELHQLFLSEHGNFKVSFRMEQTLEESEFAPAVCFASDHSVQKIEWN